MNENAFGIKINKMNLPETKWGTPEDLEDEILD